MTTLVRAPPPRPLWECWHELTPRLAGSPLLAAFDFDGTLVPIRATPEEAAAEAAPCDGLARLAAAPDTAVAVVSGRSVAALRQLVPADAVWLVGLHGLELAAPGGQVVTAIDLDTASARLEPLRQHAHEIAARHAGVRVEDKGATLALHTRQADRASAAAAAAELRESGAIPPGYGLVSGKEVLEVKPAGHNKGTALWWVKRYAGSVVTLYAGDDTTDEDVFAALAGTTVVSVLVGPAQRTAAAYCVESPADVCELIDRLAALRR